MLPREEAAYKTAANHFLQRNQIHLQQNIEKVKSQNTNSACDKNSNWEVIPGSSENTA